MATDSQLARNVLTRIGYKIKHKELLDKLESIILILYLYNSYYRYLEFIKSTISSS